MEDMKEYQHRYYENHKEERREYARKYRAEHREDINLKRREYYHAVEKPRNKAERREVEDAAAERNKARIRPGREFRAGGHDYIITDVITSGARGSKGSATVTVQSTKTGKEYQYEIDALARMIGLTWKEET